MGGPVGQLVGERGIIARRIVEARERQHFDAVKGEGIFRIHTRDDLGFGLPEEALQFLDALLGVDLR